jgi:hypothetical protein
MGPNLEKESSSLVKVIDDDVAGTILRVRKNITSRIHQAWGRDERG